MLPKQTGNRDILSAEHLKRRLYDQKRNTCADLNEVSCEAEVHRAKGTEKVIVMLARRLS